MFVQLEHCTGKEAAKRALALAVPPLLLTAALGVLAEALSGAAASVLVKAVSGQLALPLIKLLFYASFFVLMLIGMLGHRVSRVQRAFLWLTRPLTHITFDYSSVAFGVVLGLTPALWWERGAAFAFSFVIGVAPVFLALPGFVWLGARIAGGAYEGELDRAPWIQTLLCGALCVVVLWYAVHDKW